MRLLVAACTDGGITLFDTANFQRRPPIKGDCNFGVAISPDNQLVAIPGRHGGGVILWDVLRNRDFFPASRKAAPLPSGVSLTFIGPAKGLDENQKWSRYFRDIIINQAR